MASPKLSAHLLTADEFYRLDDPTEGGKMELIEGRVLVDMPPGGEHGELTSLLVIHLGVFVQRHRIGKIVNDAGFRITHDPDTVLAPDVAFLALGAIPAGRLSKSYIPGRPTLAVEVVSPNDVESKVMLKTDLYLDAGVERVWLVRPNRQTVTVFREDRSDRIVGLDGVLESDDAGFSVAGFRLPVAELFG